MTQRPATRRPASRLLALLAPVALLVPAAAAQTGGWTQQPITQPQQRQTQGQETRLQGEVRTIRQVQLGTVPQNTVVQIRFQDGRETLVDLGRNVNLDDLDLRQGDRVTLRGSETTLGGERVFTARSLSVEGQDVDLASLQEGRMGQEIIGQRPGQRVGQQDRGFPVAQRDRRTGELAGQVSVEGRVQNVRQINLRGAPPQHTIVAINLQDGREILVNLGRQTRLADIDIQRGDFISIRGDRSFAGNQTVLSANTLTVEGQQYNLGWQDPQFARDGRQPQDFQRIIGNWSQSSQDAARNTIQAYGQPDEFTNTLLIWYNNGPWARTIVHNDPVQHNFPTPHEDVLAQTVKWDVPVQFFTELARFHGSIVVDRSRGEVTASNDDEAMNFLALNLAYDIVNGNLNVQEARQRYARIARAHEQGQRHAYTTQLQFQPQRNTGDPDRPVRGEGRTGTGGGLGGE